MVVAVPSFVATIAIVGVLTTNYVTLRSETLRRQWDDQQKVMLKCLDAALAFISAVIQTVEALTAAGEKDRVRAKGEVHTAILQMRGLGASGQLVSAAEDVLRTLSEWAETRNDHADELRARLDRFVTVMVEEFRPLA